MRAAAPGNAPRRWEDAVPPERVEQRLRRSPLLIALDIDGTIAPLAPTPQEAEVPPVTLGLLQRLAALSGVHVAFVTGRAASDGRRLAAVERSHLIGNHGLELLHPDGTVAVHEEAQDHARHVTDAAHALTAALSSVPGVIVENKTWSLSIHFRLTPRPDVARVIEAVNAAAAQHNLRLTSGKEIVELRPRIASNKGTALLSLADTLGVWSGGVLRGAILYAGDDRTDEDAFRALRSRSDDAITIRVGPTASDEDPTAAEFTVADPGELRAVLEWVEGAR